MKLNPLKRMPNKKEEEKRKKEMEAEHPAGYQTRAASPPVK
jgi:hypothetical protein